MAKRNNFNRYRLVGEMKDPTKQIISTKIAVVLQDKFPKSKHHYLVLPRHNIPSIYDLDSSHLNLLSKLYLLALETIQLTQCPKDNFKIGFHVKPSMHRVHLHVISQDFISPWMKKNSKWNSFNTKLFISYDELVQTLKENGRIEKPAVEVLNDLRKTELKCNQCNHKPRTMTDLKSHLLLHELDLLRGENNCSTEGKTNNLRT